ncbi:MAG: ASKHA domain-containing protein [Treponema sp.]
MICKICHHCGLCEGDGSLQDNSNFYVEKQSSLFNVEEKINSVQQTESFSNKLSTSTISTSTETFSPIDIGIAFDIGTTTIAAVAYNLFTAKLLAEDGEENLQTSFGTDVIARISFASDKEKYGALHQTVLIQINKIVKTFMAQIQAQFLGSRQGRAELKKIVITGNTAMMSFAFGASVECLKSFPFKSESSFGISVKASALFNNKSVIPQDTEIYFPPIVSPFVGGDTVCAMISTYLFAKDKSSVLILADIGTNCELALYNPLTKKIICTSTAAGPAFEGQSISCGMTSSEGAIAEVKISDGKINCKVIGGVKAKGICGTGLLSACSELYKSNLIDTNGTFTNGKDKMELAKGVFLTQKDIRNFQLAKGAVESGIETLIENQKCAAEKSTLFLAGGFGTKLNVEDAKTTGLIPNNFNGTVVSAGNASLLGASLLLFGEKYLSIAKNISSLAQNIDLAQDPDFQKKYIASLNFNK